MLPYLGGQPPWFSFIVHPRTFDDLHDFAGSSIIAEHSSSEAEFRAKVLSLPPTVVGEMIFGFSPIRGELISISRMPNQVMHLSGQRAIVEAVKLAASRGSQVVGLGALTAPATHGGLSLLDGLPKGLTVTTGNALTAAVARQNVMEAIAALNRQISPRVAVVGCTGSVGVAASRLLAQAGLDLVLVGRSAHRVEAELPDLVQRFEVSRDGLGTARCDIVLLLTGDRTARLTPELVKPGAVVIDFAQPANIERAAYAAFASRGVRVVQGGIVKIPNYYCTAELGLPDRRHSFACLAETYLFAREGIREHSVGRASTEIALHLEKVAARHGVTARPLGLRPAGAPLAAVIAS